MQFIKPPKLFDEQVDILVDRGMVITDRNRAKRYLSHLNLRRTTFPIHMIPTPICGKSCLAMFNNV